MSFFPDHNSLIDALGGGAAVATGIGEQPVTVRAWKPRNKIPPEYWLRLIEFASNKGVEVTSDWLMRTTPARRRVEVAPEQAQPAEERVA